MFKPRWRNLLPSFYDFDHYLGYTPNLLAIAFVLAIIAAGIWLAVRRHRIEDGVRGHNGDVEAGTVSRP